MNAIIPKPKVSVVTTVYNGEDYFDRAVPSILNQEFTNFEWLIVDDGSTDSTPIFLADLATKDDRVKVLSPGRLGFAKALNYAISQAQGDYIARQDFDDSSYSNRFLCQVELLEANSDVGIVGCHYLVKDENRGEEYIRQIPQSHKDLSRMLAKCIPFAHTLVMFRKQCWTEAGGYPELDDIEDLRLWITFAKLGWRLSSVSDVLGAHWVHPKSFWHSNFEYSRRQKKLMKIQWQAIRELNLPFWMIIYPLGRYFYFNSPKQLKKVLRRVLAGSKEKDVE